MILQFEISNEAYKFLSEMGDNQFEYRDSEYKTLEEFKASTDHEANGGIRHINYFMNRNSDGTLYLIDELKEFGLVQHCEDSWHTTYEISDFGKKCLNK